MRLSLLALLAVAACGGPQSARQIQVEGTVAAVEVQLPPPPPPPPPPAKPAPIWGVNTIADVNPDPNTVEFDLTAEEKMITLTSGMSVQMYTYNGVFPGPLIEAKAGDRLIVHFTNKLKEPTTIHWHGLRISDQMDGNPRIQTPVPAGGTFTYDFVVPEAGTFWYHPHVRANEQVERGLYGPIVIRSAAEPIFDADRFFVLDDVLLANGGFVPFMQNHMEGMMGRYGNYLLVNGHVATAEYKASTSLGNWERWRFVNTANARTMELQIAGATFRVIGTDGGLLKTPFTTTRLELPVGQRYEVEVHYDRVGEVSLTSHVLAQTSGGGSTEIAKVLFKAVVGAENPAAKAPVYVTTTPGGGAVTVMHELVFDAMNDPVMGLMWEINGASHSTTPLFTARKGDTVLLRLKNMVDIEHPFHLHGQFFEVLGKPSQVGLKDVILIGPGETIDILAHLDNPGRWMAHCHILEHAELGMMAEFIVSP